MQMKMDYKGGIEKHSHIGIVLENQRSAREETNEGNQGQQEKLLKLTLAVEG